MLTKSIIIGKIEVVETGHVQIRQDTVITDAGVEVARTYHRWVLDPGASLKGQDARVAAVCRAVWTPAVVKASRERQT